MSTKASKTVASMLPLTKVQKVPSKGFRTGLNRTFSSFSESDDENVGQIECNNFGNLVKNTPFKSARGSFSSTPSTCSGLTSPKSNKDSQSETEGPLSPTPSKDTEENSRQGRSLVLSPTSKAPVLRKKSHFSKYAKISPRTSQNI